MGSQRPNEYPAAPVIPLVPSDQLNPVPSFFTSCTNRECLPKTYDDYKSAKTIRLPFISDRQGFKDPPCDPTAIGCRSEALGASHLPQIVWELPVRRIATLHSQRLAPGRSF